MKSNYLALLFIAFFVAAAFKAQSNHQEILRLKGLVHEWEQRWRDCQAALSMLRTPHAADAVSDVTQ